MLYKVFHANEPTFGMAGLGDTPKFPEDYSHVATVDCEGLDHAFEKTNHIDHDWTTNPEVVELKKSRNRSTSVGDILQSENGMLHYCAPVGWDILVKEN